MNIFTLTQSKHTPEVIFDLENGELVFNGNSIPEDVALFYSPLLAWIEKHKTYIVEDMKHLFIKVDLVYFNSATLKYLVSILKHVISLKDHESILILWLYDREDEDMLETAKDISSVLSIPITCLARN